MKYADCNARQKKAYRNIYHASNWLLGGLENTMLDKIPRGPRNMKTQRRPWRTTTAWSRSSTEWRRRTFTTTEAAASARRREAT